MCIEVDPYQGFCFKPAEALCAGKPAGVGQFGAFYHGKQ